MDFEKLLKEKQNTMTNIANRINQVENEKLQLAQEMFRLEGETRLLQSLISEAKNDTNTNDSSRVVQDIRQEEK